MKRTLFFECARKPLLLVRLIGLLPIEGLFSSNSSNTRLNLKSWYSVIYFLNLSIMFINVVLIYHDQVDKETILKHSAGIVIFTTTAIILISFFYLSKNWRVVLHKIESIELLLPPLRNYKIFVKRIDWFVKLMLLIGITEHTVYTAYTIVMVKHCFLLTDDSGWYLKSYYSSAHHWDSNIISLNYTYGFIIQVMKLQASVLNTLADIFIVVVTAYLTFRFKNFYRIFTHIIKNKTGKQVPWFEIQAQFTRLTKLVLTVDKFTTPFVFTAFLSHLLLICILIYNIIRKNQIAQMFSDEECVFKHSGDTITVLFLFTSSAVLILRALLVSLMTAHLHTLSREPLNALHTAPSSTYDYDMQKFMDQVYHSNICLSGLRFFYVTRGTVLSMVSTILTYEFVLLQIK